MMNPLLLWVNVPTWVNIVVILAAVALIAYAIVRGKKNKNQ
jgi:hypothetical protein